VLQTDVEITVVVYNSSEHLEACLAAIRPDVDAGRTRVSIVDNASPDNSADIAGQCLPTARIVQSDVNRGFAGGCNLAWPVEARYWMLLNPDLVLDSGTIAALVDWMDDHPDVGAASPWLREGDDSTPEFPGQAFPLIGHELLEFLRLHRLIPARRRAALLQRPYVYTGPTDAATPDAQWIPGAALISRTEAVREVGLLDERFFLYGEDVEWCWRFRRAGWRIAACPVGGGKHYESASSRRTWTDQSDVSERISEGFINALVRMRGRRYARLYARFHALVLHFEAHHPGRPAESRRRFAQAATAWEGGRRRAGV
jgi:N-acetylglucosaminyl-diphospho-decaprenol L-rhamnosyltransferase